MDKGAQLRASREARGLSIGSLARRTRVQPRILSAIELNDLSSIPPKPFGRGFVRAYAGEVGLDPDVTVREYFAQFAPAPGALPPEPAPAAPAPRPAWLWPAAGAGAVVLLATAMLLSGRGPAAEQRQEAVGTSGSTLPATQPAAGAAGGVAALPAPVRTVAPERMTATLEVSRDCWIAATVDGERAVYALVPPGTREALSGAREIVIRAGDAGAITWTLNGRRLGLMGKPGEVRTVTITPERVATIQ